MTGNLLSAPDHPKDRNGQLESATSDAVHLPQKIQLPVIGHDFATSEIVSISNEHRCGGLYILGQPRTGKSSLLVSLALSDIKNGHGIVFIDPHTDAINDLIAQIPEGRLKDILLLDPTDKSHSFGLNLLRCDDPHDPLALDDTCGRVRGIFAKVWGGEEARLGIWLDKIVKHSVYLLLENPKYTLVDIPLILDEDTRFRNYLLSNVKVKPYLKDFWFNELDRLSKHDKTDQVGPALSRLDVFRSDHTIRHMVGQERPKIDFHEIVNSNGEQKIILLRLPARLGDEIKRLIGTMLLSEMLYVILSRDRIAEPNRRFFGLFCDEFQEFATPDFAKLFTQTGKYKVMPVAAHQERVGQFKQGDPNRGATAAAANKVVFSLSVHDANELAGEFAAKPPVEIRLERTGVIANDPIAELLRGRRTNPFINYFTDHYLRPLVEKRDDARGDMERVTLLRGGLRDVVQQKRTEAQIEGLVNRQDRNYVAIEDALQNAADLLGRAQEQAGILITLFDSSEHKRLLIRDLNKLFVAIMEGSFQPKKGNEEFCALLVERALESPRLDNEYKKVMELYIQTIYGDPNLKRVVPFELAHKHNLFQERVTFHLNEAEERAQRRRRELEEIEWREFEKSFEIEAKGIVWNRECEQEAERHLINGMTHPEYVREDWWSAGLMKWYFGCLEELPCLSGLLKSYYKAKFTASWSYLGSFRSESDSDAYIKKLMGLFKSPDGRTKRLERFLRRYKEGGIVVLAIIGVAAEGYWRRQEAGFNWHWKTDWLQFYREHYWEENRALAMGAESLKDDLGILAKIEYKNTCMSDFPMVAGADPIEHLRVIKQLNAYLRGAGKTEKLFNFDTSYERGDVKEMEQFIEREWAVLCRKWPAVEKAWRTCDELARRYLVARACDLVRYGEMVANKTFPKSAVTGGEELVTTLVYVMNEKRAAAERKEKKERYEKERSERENYIRKKMTKISFAPPDNLEERVLTIDEVKAIEEACEKELKSGGLDVEGTRKAIKDFAEFCELISKPENHIKIPGYVEKEVPSRSTAEMINEMEQELVHLPRYVAYAKVTGGVGGEEQVSVRKIRTRAPPERLALEVVEERTRVIMENTAVFYMPRAQIEREIEQRQEEWRRAAAPPAESRATGRTRVGEKKGEPPPPQEA